MECGSRILTAQHSTAQHSTAQHSTAQHSTAQHSTLNYILNDIWTSLSNKRTVLSVEGNTVLLLY